MTISGEEIVRSVDFLNENFEVLNLAKFGPIEDVKVVIVVQVSSVKLDSLLLKHISQFTSYSGPQSTKLPRLLNRVSSQYERHRRSPFSV